MAFNPQPPSRRLRFEDFEVDLHSGELWERGNRLRLQEQPFQVLRLLLDRRGDVVSRDTLKQALWSADTFVDFDDGLNTAVKKIRDVLGDSAEKPRFVETIPKRGYRFVAQCHEVQPENPISPANELEPGHDLRNSVSEASSPHGLSVSRVALSRSSKMFAVLAAALLIAGASSAIYWRRATGTKPRAINSLAVLPLKNLSGDQTQDYLADGMTEALIGRLAGIHDLRVISRTSITSFKNTRLLVPEIAKTLNVDAIVEGSVIREGNRIRVHAQLIRASTDEHFWSESYDREVHDVLALESDVAQSIAEKVAVTLTGEEHARLNSARPVAPEVYENYLRGNLSNRNTKAGFEESIRYFEEAIKKDPTFAPAYLGLAYAYEGLGSVFGGAEPSETRPKVTIAARKALELDPELADAHALLAETYQREWNWREAESEFKRAIELKPNDAYANRGYAGWLLCQGRTEEAVSRSAHARSLDPLGVDGLISDDLILFHARHYDESIRDLRNVLAVRPDDAVARWFLGYGLIAKGQPEQAVPELEKAISLSDRSPAVIGVAIRAYAHAGRQTEALQLLAELKKRKESGYVPTAAFINAYLGLGDNEQAFFWLERAYQEKSNILQFLKVHPHFDPLRKDPRFNDLLRRVGLN